MQLLNKKPVRAYLLYQTVIPKGEFKENKPRRICNKTAKIVTTTFINFIFQSC